MSERRAKISVCMATRNGAKFIAEQLASILPQLDPGDEVIVSDDSSTDATVELVKGIGDPRIRLFERQSFCSPVFNFENAIRNATGEIIVLSDQDDVWMENKVRLIRERFQAPPSPVHLIALDGVAVDEAGRVIEESLFRRMNAGSGVLKNIYDNTYMGCCLAFSRPLLDVALPFPGRIPMHDMWLGILAELFGTVEFVGEKTITYRRHAATATQFRRSFIPFTQIGRRINLCCSLAARYFARKVMEYRSL